MGHEYHDRQHDKPHFNLRRLERGIMAYEAGALDAILAAAAGDDRVLFAELRQAFTESLERQIDLLRRARCDGNWHVAAMRLRGLAASFNADPLIALAEEAIEAAPGDPLIVRRLQTFLDEFAAG
jgi:hypothetical protein